MTRLPLQHSPAAGPGARRRSLRALPLAGLLAALACVAPLPAAAAGVSLHDPWMRLVIPSRPAAGYFTLSNDTGKPQVLTGAASPACGSLMLHRSLSENGMERMAMVKSVTIPAHGRIAFAPGGYHLMCLSPSAAVTPGGSVSVTLHFADGATLTAACPGRGASGRGAALQISRRSLAHRPVGGFSATSRLRSAAVPAISGVAEASEGMSSRPAPEASKT